MSAPCCIVGKHPNIADIDRLIRAQQAASRANNATSVPSYSQIAKRFGIARPSLLRHRDECLAVDRGAPSAVDSGRIASDSAALTPALQGVSSAAPSDVDRGVSNAVDGGVSTRDGQVGPASVDRGVQAHRGQATGPPSDGTDRHERVPSTAQNVPSRVAQRDADVAVDSRVGDAKPPTDPETLRARARERGKAGWAKVVDNAVHDATRNITNALLDSEITDPNVRAHGSYIQEVVEIIGRDEWENTATVTRLARAWDRPQMFVLGCYRDACALRRMARGSPNEDREVSLVRWVNLYKIAIANGDALSLKVASDALKGYDAASGIVDKSTRVHVNIAQDPQAQELVRRILVTLQQFPDALAAVRSSLSALGADGDPTALLTTGTVVE